MVTKIVKEVGQQAPIYPKILRQKKWHVYSNWKKVTFNLTFRILQHKSLEVTINKSNTNIQPQDK